MSDQHNRPSLSLMAFIISSCVISFAAGMVVSHHKVFPYAVLEMAREGYDELIKLQLRQQGVSAKRKLIWYYRYVNRPVPGFNDDHAEATPGLNLVTRVANHLDLAVELRDLRGQILHSWSVNWFDVWPDAQHLSPDIIPKSPPGTHIHGCVLLANGNLVISYEHLGTVCLDPLSRVVWKLPYKTHHSITLLDGGNLWICAQKTHETADPDFAFRNVPFDEYIILEVSPDGVIVNEWSVDRILIENGLISMYQENRARGHAFVQDDIFHLNDAEPFPADMKPGIFGPDDVLVSLRNINTVLVFNTESRRIKYISKPGMFSHQHDADFIDGNSFSVFDNNVLTPFEWEPGAQSRIVTVSALDDSVQVAYTGSPEQPFFTPIMGKHQRLGNNHLLITESMEGRAFEVDGNGDIVWEWMNLMTPEVVGITEEVQRVPAHLLATIKERTQQE